MAYSTSALSTSKGASDTVSVNDWNVGLADNLHTGVMRAIAEVTATAATASLDITGISTGYRGLQFEGMVRAASTSGTTQPLMLRFNGDAGANYQWIRQTIQLATGSTWASSTGDTSLGLGNIVASQSAAADLFASFVVKVPNYASTMLAKNVISDVETLFAGSTQNHARHSVGGNWNNDSAITQVTMLVTVGNLGTNSKFTVYGMPYTTTS